MELLKTKAAAGIPLCVSPQVAAQWRSSLAAAVRADVVHPRCTARDFQGLEIHSQVTSGIVRSRVMNGHAENAGTSPRQRSMALEHSATRENDTVPTKTRGVRTVRKRAMPRRWGQTLNVALFSLCICLLVRVGCSLEADNSGYEPDEEDLAPMRALRQQSLEPLVPEEGEEFAGGASKIEPAAPGQPPAPTRQEELAINISQTALLQVFVHARGSPSVFGGAELDHRLSRSRGRRRDHSD